MIVLDTLFPLFALLFLGVFLKQTKMINGQFMQTADRLVYYIFFPAMLFWKVAGGTVNGGGGIGLIQAALFSVVTVFVLSLVFISRSGLPGFQAGTFSQACYRFNTYIGMAIVVATLGEEGVRHFAILIGVMIPLINVMAVSVLIWYGERKLKTREKALYFFKALVSNPLILACVAGFIVSWYGINLPGFLNNSFSLMTSATLPLALISIGGNLSFKGLARYARPSALSCIFKLLVLPATGFVSLKIFQVTGIPFQVGMIFFCLPASPAIYVLSAQLKSDTELASVAIMLSTLISFIPLSFALML